jgi:hypothetical protein
MLWASEKTEQLNWWKVLTRKDGSKITLKSCNTTWEAHHWAWTSALQKTVSRSHHCYSQCLEDGLRDERPRLRKRILERQDPSYFWVTTSTYSSQDLCTFFDSVLLGGENALLFPAPLPPVSGKNRFQELTNQRSMVMHRFVLG